jgi:hypothetical protein
MITPEQFQRAFPKAVEWVREVDAAILLIGEPLPSQCKADAVSLGIARADEVRMAVRREMLLPVDAELRQLAAETGLIHQGTEGMTFGHGIMLKAGSTSRGLIAHELVHVRQCERLFGIENFLRAYLPEILPPQKYGEGPMEQEAITEAKRLCRNNTAQYLEI